MSEARVVLVTAPSEEAAAELCRTLVEDRLAACGNILTRVRSIYSWKGELVDEGEALIVLKTERDKVPELIEKTAAIHPYEVPEVLVLEVESGHGPYLDWITSQTRGHDLRDERNERD